MSQSWHGAASAAGPCAATPLHMRAPSLPSPLALPAPGFPPAPAAPPTPQTSGGVTWRHLPCPQPPGGALPLDCSSQQRLPAGLLAGSRGGALASPIQLHTLWPRGLPLHFTAHPCGGQGRGHPADSLSHHPRRAGAPEDVRQRGGLRDGAPLSEGLRDHLECVCACISGFPVDLCAALTCDGAQSCHWPLLCRA